MNLIDFIKRANGMDANHLPNSTAVLCLVELEDTEENEVVSNIKQMVTLLSPEIIIDFFADGCDENGYIEVRLKFNNPNDMELRNCWSMLEEYRKLNSFDEVPIDTDIEVTSDTMIELMITPKDMVGIDPIFLELAFPINFTLCSSMPGKIADTLDFLFNVNSCMFHENDYLDMNELNQEVDNYIRELEYEYHMTEDELARNVAAEEASLQKQMDTVNQAIDKPEPVYRIKIGGKSNEDEDNL